MVSIVKSKIELVPNFALHPTAEALPVSGRG
jgi:hypothetical protein